VFFPGNHARLTEIQSAFIEHPQKLPNRLEFGDLPKEFIMSASQPSRFAPSPSQSRPRSEFVFEPLLDSDEAAQLLRIHLKTLQRMARNRQIHGIQVGKLWRFRASDLEIWLRTKKAG
jgi:excisionase family DNA binding protein